MSSAGSVTVWIRQLEEGHEPALARLHARYWPQLVALARRRLNGHAVPVADEEDVAHEAFWSFCRRVKDGAFQLESRHDLLALLTHIVACKAVNHLQRELGVQKRGGSRLRISLQNLAADVEERLTCDQRSPLDQALLNDCYQQYMNGLADHLRAVAELYLAGFTYREIANQLGCAERTVQRKLTLTFHQWQRMAQSELDAE